MKRVYLAVSFLVICIALCIFEQYMVESTYKASEGYVKTAIEYAQQEDYKKAERVCTEFADYWNKRYLALTAMIEHGTLDDASITINSLEDMAKEENEELISELITTKNQIKNIRDNQKVTLGNIF